MWSQTHTHTLREVKFQVISQWAERFRCNAIHRAHIRWTYTIHTVIVQLCECNCSSAFNIDLSVCMRALCECIHRHKCDMSSLSSSDIHIILLKISKLLAYRWSRTSHMKLLLCTRFDSYCYCFCCCCCCWHCCYANSKSIQWLYWSIVMIDDSGLNAEWFKSKWILLFMVVRNI